MYNNIIYTQDYIYNSSWYTSVGFGCICMYACIFDVWMWRDSQCLQNHVPISHRYCWSVLQLNSQTQILKEIMEKWQGLVARVKDNNKWLIWLLCREPLQWNGSYNSSVHSWYPSLLGADHWCQILQDTQILQAVWQRHQEHRLRKKRKVIVTVECTSCVGTVRVYILHYQIWPHTYCSNVM